MTVDDFGGSVHCELPCGDVVQVGSTVTTLVSISDLTTPLSSVCLRLISASEDGATECHHQVECWKSSGDATCTLQQEPVKLPIARSLRCSQEDEGVTYAIRIILQASDGREAWNSVALQVVKRKSLVAKDKGPDSSMDRQLSGDL